MTTHRISVLAILFCISSNCHASDGINFYTFSDRVADRSAEVLKRNASNLTHPDLGILPQNSPCKDCIEDLGLRNADSRTFVVPGSESRHFFKQQSVGAINYLENGFWRSIEPQLERTNTPGVFKASRQPNPVTIDVTQRKTIIESAGHTLEFNKDLELAWLDSTGVHSLGTPDWSNYTAGEGGVRIFDFYPGVDVEFIVYEGRVKTNIILRQRLNINGAYLLLLEGMSLNGLRPDKNINSEGEEQNKEIIRLLDSRQEEVFSIGKGFIYDNGEDPASMIAATGIMDERFFMAVPIHWLNNPDIRYPVTLDPLVSASNNVPQAAITGSGYNLYCFLGGCNYVMPAVNVPANCTITGIQNSFSYMASSGAAMKDGAIRIYLDSCAAPKIDLVFTEPSNLSGVANMNYSLYSYFGSCIRAPQCASYSMNFSMDFFRCNVDAISGCSSSAISAASPWIITVEGHTVEMNSISPAQVVCTGESVTLQATATYGVGPYTYSWLPGSLNGSPVTVTPGASQVYTCTVTDACGSTASNTVAVTVTAGAPASVTLTPNGTVCGGSATTFNALPVNGGTAPNFSWYIDGVPMQSGPSSVYTYTPSLNSDSLSVIMTSNSNCLVGGTAQAWIVTDSTINTSVSLVPAPMGPYCVGEAITLTATPVSGGPAASYGWSINNTFVAWTTSNVFHYSVHLGAARTFRVWMVSTLPCVSNDTVGSLTRSIVGQPLNQPTVFISQVPPNPVCLGSLVTFTTVTMNGGTAPTFDWYVNGVLVSNNGSYSTSTLLNNDSVAVVLHSNSTANCLGAPTDTDAVIIQAVTIVQPAVSINQIPSGPACPDDCLFFNAIPVNGGTAPLYQWMVNGANVVGATNAYYTACNFADNDTVAVVMTSNASCAVPGTASYSSPVAVTSVDTSVSSNGHTLTAFALGASYQWLYCDSNMLPIPGATGRSMVAPVNGYFAVSVTQNGCVDTSGCWQVLGVGINELSDAHAIKVYPNPTSGSVILSSQLAMKGRCIIRLRDVLGKLVFERSVSATGKTFEEQIEMGGFSPGMYFLSVEGQDFSFTTKLVKQ